MVKEVLDFSNAEPGGGVIETTDASNAVANTDPKNAVAYQSRVTTADDVTDAEAEEALAGLKKSIENGALPTDFMHGDTTVGAEEARDRGEEIEVVEFEKELIASVKRAVRGLEKAIKDKDSQPSPEVNRDIENFIFEVQKHLSPSQRSLFLDPDYTNNKDYNQRHLRPNTIVWASIPERLRELEDLDRPPRERISSWLNTLIDKRRPHIILSKKKHHCLAASFTTCSGTGTQRKDDDFHASHIHIFNASRQGDYHRDPKHPEKPLFVQGWNDVRDGQLLELHIGKVYYDDWVKIVPGRLIKSSIMDLVVYLLRSRAELGSDILLSSHISSNDLVRHWKNEAKLEQNSRDRRNQEQAVMDIVTGDDIPGVMEKVQNAYDSGVEKGMSIVGGTRADAGREYWSRIMADELDERHLQEIHTINQSHAAQRDAMERYHQLDLDDAIDRIERRHQVELDNAIERTKRQTEQELRARYGYGTRTLPGYAENHRSNDERRELRKRDRSEESSYDRNKRSRFDGRGVDGRDRGRTGPGATFTPASFRQREPDHRRRDSSRDRYNYDHGRSRPQASRDEQYDYAPKDEFGEDDSEDDEITGSTQRTRGEKNPRLTRATAGRNQDPSDPRILRGEVIESRISKPFGKTNLRYEGKGSR